MRNDQGMRGLGRGVTAALIAALGLLVFGAVPAAASGTITSKSTCCNFDSGPFYQDLGENPLFENPVGSDAPHNVTANAKGPDGGPLFRSDTIAAGGSTGVDGTQYLGAGTYPFYCTIHGPSMSGELVVEGEKGTVAARPRIDVRIQAQKLRKVRRSGRVKVRVKAVTDISSVVLRVKRGRKTLGFRTGLSLPAGTSRTVSVKLTRAGRKALAKGRRVGLKLTGSVAFGRPDSAKRKLR